MKLISEHDLVDGYFNQWFAFQEIYFAYVRKITVFAGKTPNTNENPNGMQYSDTKKNRRVWRYQSGNRNPPMEEEQTTQWPKEKGQKNKQRSTKHTHKTKDRVTRTH
jgi:hypothetical protein